MSYEIVQYLCTGFYANQHASREHMAMVRSETDENVGNDFLTLCPRCS